MTLTVGTDAYDTLANIDLYWSDRGNTAWAALTDANKEIYIRKATDWLDRQYYWRGVRATQTQRLGWPRTDAYDDDDYLFSATETPFQVKEACAIIADIYRDGTIDMEGIITSDVRSLRRQKVDVIEVEYDPNSRLSGEASIAHVIKLLKSVTIGSQGRLQRV
jgi:hypothetical protein